MNALAWWFQEGGWAMWVVLLADLALVATLGVVVVLALAAGRSRGVALAARGAAAFLLVGTLVPAGVGALGYALGMRNVEAAIVHVDPSMQDELRAAGEAEASNNLWFGGGSTALCLLPSLALVAFAFTRRPPEA